MVFDLQDMDEFTQENACSILTFLLGKIQRDVEFEIFPMKSSMGKICPLYTQFSKLMTKDDFFRVLHKAGILKMKNEKYSPNHHLLSQATSISSYLDAHANFEIQGRSYKPNGQTHQSYYVKIVNKLVTTKRTM